VNDRVEVRIHKVDNRETDELNNLIEALHSIHSHEVVKQNHQSKDYVVVVESATISEIKKILFPILQIFEANRISIDT